MKIASTVARYLMGLMFTVFGLNGFFQFLPQPPMKGALAGQYLGSLVGSHYIVPVFLLQVICGLLFLWGKYLPLALTLIAPVIVNILLFHITMNIEGIAPGLVVAICWVLVFLRMRPAFEPLLRMEAPEADAEGRSIGS